MSKKEIVNILKGKDADGNELPPENSGTPILSDSSLKDVNIDDLKGKPADAPADAKPGTDLSDIQYKGRPIENYIKELERKAEKVSELKPPAEAKPTDDLSRVRELLENPEIKDFEGATQDQLDGWMDNDKEKVDRYYKWKVEKDLAIKTDSINSDTAKADVERAQIAETDRVLGVGVESVRNLFSVDISKEDLAGIAQNTSLEDAYKLNLINKGEYDKALTLDQREGIAKNYISYLKGLKDNSVPHDVSKTGGAPAGTTDPTNDITSYADFR